LGVVFAGAREPLEQHFRPLVDYVARKLSASQSTKGAVSVTPSAGQMIKLLEEKQVDFYMESPYPTYMINRLGSARLLLRSWKGGMAEYRSVIFTRKDSGVAQLKDLRGKLIAFEDRGSTSGYFLPKVFLLKRGFSVEEKATLQTKIGAGEIGYVFAQSATAIVTMVLEQKAAAGAFSTDDYARLEPDSKKSIANLGETESVPRHLVSVRKDLPEPMVKRLREILLGMHQDAEGRQILLKTDDTTKFDALPGGEELVRRKLVELYRPRGRQ
jgi:phosphonate transport system substrate-binding protein